MTVFVKPVVKDDRYKYDEKFYQGLSGIGYKDAQKVNTISITNKLLENEKITKSKQIGIIMKMYYRAKNHKFQSENMRKAINVYKDWLKEHDPQ